MARIVKNVAFSKPVTVSKNYILVVEYDSSTTRPAVVPIRGTMEMAKAETYLALLFRENGIEV